MRLIGLLVWEIAFREYSIESNKRSICLKDALTVVKQQKKQFSYQNPPGFFPFVMKAFEFYNLLREQATIRGTIFDPPPAAIRGNIINTIDPNEEVIGFFGAFGASRIRKKVDLSIIETPVIPNPIHNDCRALDNSTVEVPPFWRN